MFFHRCECVTHVQLRCISHRSTLYVQRIPINPATNRQPLASARLYASNGAAAVGEDDQVRTVADEMRHGCYESAQADDGAFIIHEALQPTHQAAMAAKIQHKHRTGW